MLTRRPHCMQATSVTWPEIQLTSTLQQAAVMNNYLLEYFLQILHSTPWYFSRNGEYIAVRASMQMAKFSFASKLAAQTRDHRLAVSYSAVFGVPPVCG